MLMIVHYLKKMTGKTNILVLGEGLTLIPMEALVQQRKSLSLVLVRQKQNFTSVYITFMIIVICLLTKKKSVFKADNNNVIFPTQFCLGSISNKLYKSESDEESFKETVYVFSKDCNAINKSDILNINKYLIVKNKIKQCLSI